MPRPGTELFLGQMGVNTHTEEGFACLAAPRLSSSPRLQQPPLPHRAPLPPARVRSPLAPFPSRVTGSTSATTPDAARRSCSCTGFPTTHLYDYLIPDLRGRRTI